MKTFKSVKSSASNIARTYLWQPLLFIIVMLAGGYVFVALEKSEGGVKRQLQNNLQSIETNILSSQNLTKEELNIYFETRTRAENVQGSLSPLQAFALCQSIALTTGWGRIVPTTDESKVFFLFYSCFSIATTAVIMKSVSSILNDAITRTIKAIDRKIYGRTRRNGVQLQCFLFSCCLVVISTIISSCLQIHFGNSVLDAVYITFQAYTTIGFGDISQFQSPLESSVDMMPLLSIVSWFRVLGIVLLATLVNSFVKFQAERRRLQIKLKARSKLLMNKAKKSWIAHRDNSFGLEECI